MDPLFQIKVCGITSPNDASIVCQSGADAIGVNFYPESPRFVDSEQASAVVGTIDQFNREHNRVQKVGVFVNSKVDEIVLAAKSYELDAIQLHGDETPQIVQDLTDQIGSLASPAKVIRAIRLAEPSGQNQSWIAGEIRIWSEAGCHALLLDAAIPGEYGGTGETIDWESVASLDSQLPIILAGGLRTENVVHAIAKANVQAVDVASGVEVRPGVKDPAKVAAFVQLARSALGIT